MAPDTPVPARQAPPLLLVQQDPGLAPYEPVLRRRLARLRQRLAETKAQWGSLSEFAGVYQHLGLNYEAGQQGSWYREWAPAAEALSLVGDFNH